MLAMHGNSGAGALRLRERYLRHRVSAYGGCNNGSYSAFEFASSELSEMTYLQLPFFEWQPYWSATSRGSVCVVSGV
jgi:hypothetical protein